MRVACSRATTSVGVADAAAVGREVMRARAMTLGMEWRRCVFVFWRRPAEGVSVLILAAKGVLRNRYEGSLNPVGAIGAHVAAARAGKHKGGGRAVVGLINNSKPNVAP